MARIAANNPKSTASLDVSAMHTNFFDGCFNFHVFEYHRYPYLPRHSQAGGTIETGLGTADDPCPAAVRIELHLHTIADEHFNSVQTHFPGKVRKYRFAFVELYAK